MTLTSIYSVLLLMLLFPLMAVIAEYLVTLETSDDET